MVMILLMVQRSYENKVYVSQVVGLGISEPATVFSGLFHQA